MRLVCPNCDAQYEVDDSAIPAAGREVQCSACGHGWFQPAAGTAVAAAAPLAEPPRPPPEAVAPPPPPRRPLDENVMAVLREEALREAVARRAEAARGIETQPDLGLIAAARRVPPKAPATPDAPPPRPEAAPPAPLSVAARSLADPAPPAPPEPPRAPPRRELLPDIEEINSTLSARPDRRGGPGGPAPADDPRQGFRRGFLLMILLLGLLALAYVMAPRISAEIPAAAPALSGYADQVDRLRIGLDHGIGSARSGLQAMLASGAE